MSIPQKVEEITWVPEKRSGRRQSSFATTKPAAIQWGVAIEQQMNCADNDRLLMFLLGLTGNIDVPGGQVLNRTPNIINVGHFGAHGMLPRNSRKTTGR